MHFGRSAERRPLTPPGRQRHSCASSGLFIDNSVLRTHRTPAIVRLTELHAAPSVGATVSERPPYEQSAFPLLPGNGLGGVTVPPARGLMELSLL